MPKQVRDRQTFTRTRVLVCEGPADAAFLRSLIAEHALPEFDIRNPADRHEGARGGIDNVKPLIEGFAIQPGFSDVTDLLIAIDNDDDASANLVRIQGQLASIESHRYAVPLAFMQKALGTPNVSILSWPWAGGSGNLERFCLDAAQSVDPTITSCVDTFSQCAGVNDWVSQNKIGKFKLRATISALWSQNPTLPLGQVWSECPHVIPLRHASFNPLVQYLATFR